MIRKSLIALIAAMLPLVSCVKEEQKTEVQLNLSQVSLTEGETLQLTAAVTASSSASSIEWSSLNEKVAVVKDGLVTAVNPGETWIYASFGDIKEGCLVRVVEQKVLSLDRKVLYMIPGQGQLLTAQYDPSLTSELVWASSDENVVTVEEIPGEAVHAQRISRHCSKQLRKQRDASSVHHKQAAALRE